MPYQNQDIALLAEQLLNGLGTNGAFGKLITKNATITRPNDTLPYVAKDCVASSVSLPSCITFTDLAREIGGTGYITKARILTNNSTTTARFRLHLYNTDGLTVLDNNQFNLTQNPSIGFIDFDALTTEGSGSTKSQSLNTNIRLAYEAGDSKNIFGILEALDPFTPDANQTFFIELTSDCN